MHQIHICGAFFILCYWVPLGLLFIFNYSQIERNTVCGVEKTLKLFWSTLNSKIFYSYNIWQFTWQVNPHMQLIQHVDSAIDLYYTRWYTWQQNIVWLESGSARNRSRNTVRSWWNWSTCTGMCSAKITDGSTGNPFCLDQNSEMKSHFCKWHHLIVWIV